MTKNSSVFFKDINIEKDCAKLFRLKKNIPPKKVCIVSGNEPGENHSPAPIVECVSEYMC